MTDEMARATQACVAKGNERRAVEKELAEAEAALADAVQNARGAEILRLRGEPDRLRLKLFEATVSHQEQIRSTLDAVMPIHQQWEAEATEARAAKAQEVEDIKAEFNKRLDTATRELEEAERALAKRQSSNSQWLQSYHFVPREECQNIIAALAPALANGAAAVMTKG